jgi:hypothetical protein
MKAVNLQDFDPVFAKIKKLFDDRYGNGLVCKQGSYKDSSVLKLQKASWTNDPMDRLPNESGIFFSIWINEDSLRRGRANYNIHALKLRQLKGYSIASRDFAGEFRNGFASTQDLWPNVGTDYAPSTLMEGWFAIEPGIFEEKVLVLLEQFKQLSPMIDRLLASRRK